VAHLGVRAAHARLADRHVAAEVLAGRDRQVPHEVAELRRELHVVVVVVEQPDVGRSIQPQPVSVKLALSFG